MKIWNQKLTNQGVDFLDAGGIPGIRGNPGNPGSPGSPGSPGNPGNPKTFWLHSSGLNVKNPAEKTCVPAVFDL